MDILAVLGYAAVALVVFYVLSTVFGSGSGSGGGGGDDKDSSSNGKPKAPEKLTVLTKEELLEYNGEDESKPILIGIRGRLFDVSTRGDFYGRGMGYNVFTGHDASRALAKTSLDPKDVEDDNIEDLSFTETDTLRQWEQTFEQKYVHWGYVVDDEEAKKKKIEELKGGSKPVGDASDADKKGSKLDRGKGRAKDVVKDVKQKLKRKSGKAD